MLLGPGGFQPHRQNNPLEQVINYTLDLLAKTAPVLARRREHITRELFLPYCSSFGANTSVTPFDIQAAHSTTPIALTAERDTRKEYRRYESRVEFGAVVPGHHPRQLLLFEFLTAVGENRFGIPTSQSMRRLQHALSRHSPGSSRNFEVEELHSPACEVLVLDPDTKAIEDIKVLMSQDAFIEARLRLRKIKTEVDIWTVNSPFATDIFFLEQSSLIRLAFNAVKAGMMKEQFGLIMPDDISTVILGIKGFSHDDYGHQIQMKSICASFPPEPVSEPNALWERTSTISFHRAANSEITAVESDASERPIEGADRDNITNSLQAQKHLSFLRNPDFFEWLKRQPQRIHDAGFFIT